MHWGLSSAGGKTNAREVEQRSRERRKKGKDRMEKSARDTARMRFYFIGCQFDCMTNRLPAAKIRVSFEMPENKPVIGLTWEPKLPSVTSSATGSQKLVDPPKSILCKPETELVDGLFLPPNDPKKLNKLKREQLKDTAGRSWFDMPAPTITPEIKKDLQLLKLRSVMDPKRHYKKADVKSKALPKYFQVGTVIESASDFFSGRLTKKERKATLADELLSDPSLGRYWKRKVREIEQQKHSVGVEKWKIKGKQSWKRKKQQRQG